MWKVVGVTTLLVQNMENEYSEPKVEDIHVYELCVPNTAQMAEKEK